MDLKIMALEKKGKLVPTRDLIKTPEQIEGIRKSGVVNTGCLDAVAEAIHVGMNTQEIDDICMQYCKDHNAVPACLNYEGYPKSVCTSINEVVCHGIPKTEDVLQEGDIINVDMTTIVDGYYADASRMFIVGGKTTRRKNGWYVLPESASTWELRLQSRTPMSETSAMPSRSMRRRTATVSYVISAVMVSASISTNSPMWSIMVTRERACCWCRGWCLPLNR